MNKKGMVYLIPTPIGNMDDLSKRIIDTLGIVDVIFWYSDYRNVLKCFIDGSFARFSIVKDIRTMYN